MPEFFKKLVEAHRLSVDRDEGGFEKGCALIQANLGIDPTKGSCEEWAESYAKALWLEEWRLKNLNDMLVKTFSSEKG